MMLIICITLESVVEGNLELDTLHNYVYVCINKEFYIQPVYGSSWHHHCTRMRLLTKWVAGTM